MMKKTSRLKPGNRWLYMPVCVMLLLCAGSGMAQSITAQLVRQSPDKAIIEIALQRPAPGNLIVELQYPPQLTVLRVTPNPAKIDPGNGILKWLVRNAKPGKVRIQTDFSGPFSKKDLSGFVRYRTPGEGTLMEIKPTWK